MSDSDEEEAPRRWTLPNREGRALQDLQTAIRRQQARFERLSANLEDIEQRYNMDDLIFHEPDQPLTSAPPPPGPNGGAIPDTNDNVDSHIPPAGTKKPVTAFVSALPSTPYEEQKELQDCGRTLAYVQVQQKVLKYLATQSPHALTPRQARRWTQAIDGKSSPTAKEALQLCYYMRAQGFDVYNKLGDKLGDNAISLYVVNQDSYIRDARHDHLYWKQNVITGKIEFTAPSSTGRRSTRRSVFDESTFAVPEADTSASAGNRTTAQRAALRAAETELETLLRSDHADPDALAAAISHVEELRDAPIA